MVGDRKPGQSFDEKVGAQVESFYGGFSRSPVHLYVPRVREFCSLLLSPSPSLFNLRVKRGKAHCEIILHANG